MILRLETALKDYRNDLSTFSASPTLFGKSCRISYKGGQGGWFVEELGFFERISFIFSSFFGTSPSLADQNRATVERNWEQIRQCETLVPSLLKELNSVIDISQFIKPPKVPAPQTSAAPPASEQATPKRTFRANRVTTPDTSLPKPPPQANPYVKGRAGFYVEPRGAVDPNFPLKGIANSGINCWMNASVQALFRLKPFIDMIRNGIQRGENESENDFNKRLAVHMAVKELHEHYNSVSATPYSTARYVEKLKMALYLFTPGTFEGDERRKLTSQQCSNVAINGLLKALLPNGNFDPIITLERADHIRGSSIVEELEKHFKEADFFSLACYRARRFVRAFSRLPNENDEQFALREAVYNAMNDFNLLTIHEEEGENLPLNVQLPKEKLVEIFGELKAALLAFRPTLSPAFSSQAERRETLIAILDALEPRGPQTYELREDQQTILTSQFSKIPEAPAPFLILGRERLSSDGYRNILPAKGWKEEETPTTLDLSELSIEGAAKGSYRLVSVVHHRGARAGGHYTASVSEGDRLYYMNDSQPIQAISKASSYNSVAIYELIP